MPTSTWRISLIVCYLLRPHSLYSVLADCNADIGSIDTFVQLRENVSVYVFINKTTSGHENWTLSLKSINSDNNIPELKKIRLMEYFTFTTENSSLLLALNHSLDIEAIYNLTKIEVQSITLELTCSDESETMLHQSITVIIQSVDEFPPKFDGPMYFTSIPEDTPVGTHIYNFRQHVTDDDIPCDTQFIYSVEKYPDTSVDGSHIFGIRFGASGEIILQHPVDYEEMKHHGNTFYVLLLKVTDSGGLSTNTTLNITVLDSDDLGPIFIYPGCNDTGDCTLPLYHTNTTSYYRGLLDVEPNIQAKDRDSLNFTILFSLGKQADNYDSLFKIDVNTGELTQIKDVFKSGILAVKARENSTNQFSAIASISVSVSNEGNQSLSSINQTSVPTVFTKSEIDLKLILIVVCVSCSVVMIGLMIGLCIQHRRYLQSTRPIKNLSYLYVRSFKRGKVKTVDDNNPETKEYLAKNNSCSQGNNSNDKISTEIHKINQEEQKYAKQTEKQAKRIKKRTEETCLEHNYDEILKYNNDRPSTLKAKDQNDDNNEHHIELVSNMADNEQNSSDASYQLSSTNTLTGSKTEQHHNINYTSYIHDTGTTNTDLSSCYQENDSYIVDMPFSPALSLNFVPSHSRAITENVRNNEQNKNQIMDTANETYEEEFFV